MSVVGIRELQVKLGKIADSAKPKLVAQSARAAMVPMMKQARANAPQGTEAHRTYKGRLVAPGFLKRNIKLKKMKFRDKDRVGYSLAARGEAFYGKILESGFTHIGGRNKQGRRTKVDGVAWLGRAERATRKGVESRFRSELLNRINKAAK